ncbi:MAG TPA: (2Fe-2S)-binding protein [Gemmatimonadales bacterium]|jgi:sarcosine oxidase subunit alpha
MTDGIPIIVNGNPVTVTSDITLAAALLNAGVTSFHRDVHGAPRAPLCGMGTCFECRVTVDGVAGVRACLEPVRRDMRVDTGR